MRKKAPLIIVAILMLNACGNEQSKNLSTDSIPKIIVSKDSVIITDSIPAVALALTFGGDTIAPADRASIFYSFTAALSKSKKKPLSVKEVKKRFLPIDPDCEEESMYQLQRFFVLDSLKKIGEIPDGDMGQTIQVDIRLVDTIKKTPEGCWVAWTLYYTTPQACPFAEGTYFMLSTYTKEGKLVSTQCMGCDAGGGDAPISWTKTHSTNIFQDGSFRGLYADSTEDYDEEIGKPLVSIYRRTFTGQISDAGKITVEEKEIERTE